MPVAAPKTNRATHSAGTEYTSPGRRAAAETATAATALTGPAPNRAHQAPVKRMQTRAPRDRQSSAMPSVLWPAPTRAATSGTRAAQLPKTAPSRTKSAVTAARRRATDGGGTRALTGRTRPGTGMRARGREERAGTGDLSGKTPATRVFERWPRGGGRAHDLGHPHSTVTAGTRAPRCSHAPDGVRVATPVSSAMPV